MHKCGRGGQGGCHSVSAHTHASQACSLANLLTAVAMVHFEAVGEIVSNEQASMCKGRNSPMHDMGRGGEAVMVKPTATLLVGGTHAYTSLHPVSLAP